MTINKISLDDKVIYCKNKFNEYQLKYRKQDLNEYADVPFWMLKNMVTKLVIECRSKNLDFIDKQMLKKNKEFYSKNETKRRENLKSKNKDKKAKEELNDLIGLDEIKKQMEKILNYVKLNKERGQMPSLHMCFTGNPGTGKTSIARIIGKIFEEESILSGSGEFVEIHGRGLIDKFTKRLPAVPICKLSSIIWSS